MVVETSSEDKCRRMNLDRLRWNLIRITSNICGAIAMIPFLEQPQNIGSLSDVAGGGEVG